MNRFDAIVLLLVLFALGISSRWWGPLLDEYGRGLLVGLMSGVLLGQIYERRQIAAQARRDAIVARLDRLAAELNSRIPPP